MGELGATDVVTSVVDVGKTFTVAAGVGRVVFETVSAVWDVLVDDDVTVIGWKVTVIIRNVDVTDVIRTVVVPVENMTSYI